MVQATQEIADAIASVINLKLQYWEATSRLEKLIGYEIDGNDQALECLAVGCDENFVCSVELAQEVLDGLDLNENCRSET